MTKTHATPIIVHPDAKPYLTIGTIGIFKVKMFDSISYALFQETFYSGYEKWKYITETIDSAYGELENNSTNLQDAIDLALAHEFDYSI